MDTKDTSVNVYNNRVELGGLIAQDMVYSHVMKEERFYKGKIQVNRMSGTVDVLPFIISEKLLFNRDFKNENVFITGTIRTYRDKAQDKSKRSMEVFVFVDTIEISRNTTGVNRVCLMGYICKDLSVRSTPGGRVITDMILAVNRNFHKSDYIPCISWGRNAKMAEVFRPGMLVSVEGRFQSREYKKVLDSTTETSEIRVAYEVSVSDIEIK